MLLAKEEFLSRQKLLQQLWIAICPVECLHWLEVPGRSTEPALGMFDRRRLGTLLLRAGHHGLGGN